MAASRATVVEVGLRRVRFLARCFACTGGQWGGGLILAGSTERCAVPSDILETKIRKAVLSTDVPVLRIDHGLEQVFLCSKLCP